MKSREFHYDELDRTTAAAWVRSRGAQLCAKEKSPGRADARLDKLKHVPQCAARKLSAVSFQPLSGMKSSRRAKNMEG